MDRFGLESERVSVLYDRAVKGRFGPISLPYKHSLFSRVGFADVFTQEIDSIPQLKADRPLLLLTSTSYTPDEDLSLLINALRRYSKKSQEDDKLPRIILVVTGAGPQKKMFLEKFKEFNESQKHVQIHAKWL